MEKGDKKFKCTLFGRTQYFQNIFVNSKKKLFYYLCTVVHNNIIDFPSITINKLMKICTRFPSELPTKQTSLLCSYSGWSHTSSNPCSRELARLQPGRLQKRLPSNTTWGKIKPYFNSQYLGIMVIYTSSKVKEINIISNIIMVHFSIKPFSGLPVLNQPQNIY